MRLKPQGCILPPPPLLTGPDSHDVRLVGTVPTYGRPSEFRTPLFDIIWPRSVV